MTNETIPSIDWREEEAKQLTQHANYEQLPSLKLTPNVVTEVVIDFTKPFESWKGEDAKGVPVTKKIIPCTVNGTKMNFWLNVKNPLYAEIIKAKGQTTFKILQTGTQANTKYVLVK
jgi:hypothetical protein